MSHAPLEVKSCSVLCLRSKVAMIAKPRMGGGPGEESKERRSESHEVLTGNVYLSLRDVKNRNGWKVVA
ncbi:hypothetical protein E2C01_010771 [Portunus trituberculatus]|uniref:Uncharacterized protein n=1 Tax=Portunus trituberculatus TaxID=210409 RepID=A0A5B7D9B2_PORTR|nr:hypothetical protein [Portunus trituberculatus]